MTAQNPNPKNPNPNIGRKPNTNDAERVRLAVSVFGEVTIVVTGSSMAPMLRHMKDKVKLTRSEWPPKRGDILFCERGDGSLVMHRAIKVLDNAVILNGDGQIWTELVAKEMIIGKVIAIVRGGKTTSVDSPQLKIYSVCWMRLRHLRRFVFKIYVTLKKLVGRA